MCRTAQGAAAKAVAGMKIPRAERPVPVRPRPPAPIFGMFISEFDMPDALKVPASIEEIIQRFDASKEAIDEIGLSECRFPPRFDPGFPLRTDPV